LIIAQNRCTADETLDILRSASSHRNIKLRDVAHDIITPVGGGPSRTHAPFRT
jgi:AmiR/NasT family two-component response regulator